MRRLALAALLVLPLVTNARAAVFGRNRMHLVTPKLTRRLHAETQANLHRTIAIGGGSGVLVSVDGDRGLLLTNQHVMVGQPRGVPMRIYAGERELAGAPTGRVLATSEMLDYALVEVDLASLPASLRTEPARVRHGELAPGEKTYKVGFPALRLLRTPMYGSFDWTVADERKHYESQPKRMVLSVGHEVGGETRLFHDPDPRPGHRATVPRWSVAIDDSSLPGNSGSPVFSAETHEVVGLHWAGGTSRKASDPALRGDRWDSANYAVPIVRVLADLRERVGSMPTDVRAQVQALAGP